MPVTDLLSLDDAKANLDKSAGVDDAELMDVIDEATGIIEDLTGPIIPRTVTDVFPNVSGTWHGGNWRRGPTVLVLRTEPALSVTSAAISWAGVVSVTYQPADLVLNTTTGELRLLSGATWTQDVTVVYVAGRSSVPACVHRAMKEQVRHIWETQRGTSTARPSYDAEQFTQTPSGFLVPNRVAEAVAPVRRAPRVG